MRHKKCIFGSYFLARAVQQKALEYGQRVRTAIPKGLASDPMDGITSQGDRPIRLGALAAGAGDLVDGRRTEAVVQGGAK